MSALQKEYEALKLKYPDAVIWFSMNGYVEAFSDCAVKTSEVLKTVLTNRPDNLTGFPITTVDENLKKMIKCGHTVALVECSFLKPKKRAVS